MKYKAMKLYRYIQYILEHRVTSGFPGSTVRQCTDKSKTKIRGVHVGPKINRRNLLYSFYWITGISSLFDQFPCLGDFFSSKNILNTEAKYSYNIDAVTKSQYLFLVR